MAQSYLKFLLFFREPTNAKILKRHDNALIKVTNTVCLLVTSEDDVVMKALVKYNFVSGVETLITEMPFRSGYAVASLRGEFALALRTHFHFCLSEKLLVH